MRPILTKRWLVLALAMALVSAAAASAVVLTGKGELVAHGSGLAVLDLRGQVRLRGIGLLIVEPDADVEVDGTGRASFLEDGRILYEGFGRAVVRSPAAPTRIEAAGARIRLRARGVGRAFLKGVGGFHTDEVDGAWEPDVEVRLEESDGR